jgi:Rrf2 family protein
MKFNRATIYALQALLRLASEDSTTLITSHRLATTDGIPPLFLLKILGRLEQAGLVRSLKGPNGGYRLARTAERITLLDVVDVTDGPLRGEAPPIPGAEGKFFDARLQTVCEQVAALTRAALAKVRLADLVTTTVEDKPATGARKKRP